MARRHPNHRLAALLAEAGWSNAELARTVNTLAAAQALTFRYDRTSTAHWLTGSRPRPPVPDLVAAAFSEHLHRLVTSQDTGLAQTPPVPDSLPSIPWNEADAVPRLLALCRMDTDPQRRIFLTRAAYTLTALALPTAWPPPATPPPDRAPAHRTVTREHLDRLEEMTCLFATLRQRWGGGHARTALATYLADEVHPLLTRPCPTTLEGDLHTKAAQLTHLLADMSADTGHSGLAQRYFHLALHLAHHADNRRQYAITLRALSSQASRLGHHRYAHTLANAALDTIGRNTDAATLAYLHAQRAFTHAHLHQPRTALTELHAAEIHHQRANSPAGPFTAYPQAALDYQRAETFRALGMNIQAHTAFTASLKHRAPGQHRPIALTHAHLAETLLHIGYLDAACTHWHTFLDHHCHLHSTQTRQALDRMRQALRPHTQRAAASGLLHRADPLAPL